MNGTKSKQAVGNKARPSSFNLASANLSLRASKKQSEVLGFVQEFIHQHGYGPSYREIMRGLSYTSVSTVAAHINNLVAAGYLAKKSNSARSLYVLKPLKSLNLILASGSAGMEPSGAVKSHEKWLVDKIGKLLDKAEQNLEEDDFYGAQIAIKALKILGLDAAALSLSARLKQIEERINNL
jgi:SOS-response transcriptional repressor LexA